MTRRPSQVIWYELMTTDVDAAARFYGEVMGWTVVDSGQADKDYRVWLMDAVGVGGLLPISPDGAAGGMKPIWLTYVDVADVDAAVVRSSAAGGGIYMPPTEIPGVGRMALITDPQGAAYYVMTPMGEAPTPPFAPERLGHGGWNELHTTDWEAALAYYADQLGWAEARRMDMGPLGTYLVFKSGDQDIGGMVNSLGFAKPTWLCYFNVEDIEAARDRVVAAGGTIAMQPHEVPTGQWMLHGRDPQGALFGLLTRPKG